MHEDVFDICNVLVLTDAQEKAAIKFKKKLYFLSTSNMAVNRHISKTVDSFFVVLEIYFLISLLEIKTM